MSTPKPTFFATPALFRAWLEEHHTSAAELLVGFYKRDSGKPSITWPESVDQALCFGWIDGKRKSVDEQRYTIRFTPRKPRSIWSAINIAKVEALTAAGLMHPAGLAAYAKRDDVRSAVYSYERRMAAAFTPEQEARLRADAAAHAFFAGQPAGYRRTATHWVISAKREETRDKRLATLIADSAAGRRIAALIPPNRAGTPRTPGKKKGTS